VGESLALSAGQVRALWAEQRNACCDAAVNTGPETPRTIPGPELAAAASPGCSTIGLRPQKEDLPPPGCAGAVADKADSRPPQVDDRPPEMFVEGLAGTSALATQSLAQQLPLAPIEACTGSLRVDEGKKETPESTAAADRAASQAAATKRATLLESAAFRESSACGDPLGAEDAGGGPALSSLRAPAPWQLSASPGKPAPAGARADHAVASRKKAAPEEVEGRRETPETPESSVAVGRAKGQLAVQKHALLSESMVSGELLGVEGLHAEPAPGPLQMPAHWQRSALPSGLAGAPADHVAAASAADVPAPQVPNFLRDSADTAGGATPPRRGTARVEVGAMYGVSRGALMDVAANGVPRIVCPPSPSLSGSDSSLEDLPASELGSVDSSMAGLTLQLPQLTHNFAGTFGGRAAGSTASAVPVGQLHVGLRPLM